MLGGDADGGRNTCHGIPAYNLRLWDSREGIGLRPLQHLHSRLQFKWMNVFALQKQSAVARSDCLSLQVGGRHIQHVGADGVPVRKIGITRVGKHRVRLQLNLKIRNPIIKE